MSYSGAQQLHGLGSMGALIAGAADTCAGGMKSEPDGDKCCSVSTWNNGTYRQVKGVWSWRYHNEKRVREALRLLLAPDGGGLQQAAWDLNATAPPPVLFQSALHRAAQNFLQIRPPERWKKQSKGVPTICTDRGYFSVWKIQSPSVTDERLAALQDAIGAPLPPAFVTALRQSGRWNFAVAGKPPLLDTWEQNELRMLEKVPGSDAGLSVDAMPTLTTGLKPLVVRAGATVGPGAWLQSFLNYYAPGWSHKTALIVTTKLTASTKGQASAAALSTPLSVQKTLWEPEPSLADEDRPALGLGAKVAIGAAAVTAVGLGAWALRK